MPRLNRGARNLYNFLRARSPGDLVTRVDLCADCNWKASSLRTYFSKNMVTPFLIEADEHTLRLLKGGEGVTEAEVYDAFSQKRNAALVLG